MYLISITRKNLATLSLTAKNSAKDALFVLQEVTDMYSFKNEVKGFKTPGVAVVIPTSTAYAAANAASSSTASVEETLQENDFKCYKGIEDISFAFSEIIVKVSLHFCVYYFL
jgi:alpha-D-ribose 1-methylphosphonate 5-triphosphate synthase subunit PhnH